MNPAKLYQKSLTFRIYLLVFVILLPFILLLSFIYLQHYETRKSQVFMTEREVCQGAKDTLNAYLRELRKTSLLLGRMMERLPAGNSSSKILADSVADSTTVVSYSWVSPRGIVLASSDKTLIGRDLSRQPLFQQLTSRDDFVDNLAPVGLTGTGPSFVSSTALRGADGVLKGAVLAEIDAVRLSQAIVPTTRPSEGSVAVLDGKGTLAFDSGFPEVDWNTRINWMKEDTVLAQAFRTGGTELGFTSTPMEKGVSLAVVMPIEGTSWKAEARRPYDVAFATVRHGTMLDLVLLAAVMNLAFTSAYLLGRNITAPLLRLKRDALMMLSDNTAPSADPYAPAEIADVRTVLLKLLKEQQNQADELRASEKLLCDVFENVYEGIIIHDLKGNLVRVNKRSLQMFNLTSEAVQGLNVRDISCDVPKDEVLAGLWEEVLSGQTQLFEWCCKRPRDGSRFDAEVFLYPIRYKEGQMLMACVRDITESKRWAAEQQRYRDELEQRVRERTDELSKAFAEIQSGVQQRIEVLEDLRRKEQLLIQQSRLAAMGEMLGNIAHQWRQPLNTLALIIQETAYTFSSGLLSRERMNELAGKAMALVKSMSQTIDDFRNILGPDRQLENFSCKDVVEKVLSMVRIKAETDLDLQGDCCTVGFPNEFAHVILNILNNANDVLQERNVEKPLVSIRMFQETDRLVITIADNGGGIPEEVLDQIFDPYFTTKAADRGTGIGLFMSRTIVQKMGGTLTARNTAEGAEFRIELTAVDSSRCTT